MPVTTELKAKIEACRAILGCTNEPHGEAWNGLTTGYRAALLKVAELPLGYRQLRWEDLSPAIRNRLVHAAIDADGLRRFLDVTQPIANATRGAVQ